MTASPYINPEQSARQQIDAQLSACGWVVQDFKAVDFSAGRGIALREAPLKSGTCDYLLLVDRKAVGVVEAKKLGTLLSGVAEQSAHLAVATWGAVTVVDAGTLAGSGTGAHPGRQALGRRKGRRRINERERCLARLMIDPHVNVLALRVKR